MPAPILAGIGAAIGAGARAVGARMASAVGARSIGSAMGRTSAGTGTGATGMASVTASRFPVMRNMSFTEGTQDGGKTQNTPDDTGDMYRYVG